MKAHDKQAWASAAQLTIWKTLESLGFQQQEIFKIMKQEPRIQIHDTITRLDYKEDNGEFLKYKVRFKLCARGGQQILGVSFRESDLCSPVLRATEARLLLALAAAE